MYAVLPITAAADEWIEENVEYEPCQKLDEALCVEHRYIDGLVAGMRAAGLFVLKGPEVTTHFLPSLLAVPKVRDFCNKYMTKVQ